MSAKQNNLIHLTPYFGEAIARGLRDPRAILEYAIDETNKLCVEMIQCRTERSHTAREKLTRDAYEELTRPAGE